MIFDTKLQAIGPTIGVFAIFGSQPMCSHVHHQYYTCVSLVLAVIWALEIRCMRDKPAICLSQDELFYGA